MATTRSESDPDLCEVASDSALDEEDQESDVDIWEAAASGDIESVQELLEEDRASMNGRRPGDGWTPLMYATVFRHLRVAKLLLQRGADVAFVDENGENALSLAVRTGNAEALDLLLRYNSGVNSASSDSPHRRLILEAARLGHLDVVRELFMRRVDLNARDEDGNTALHLAAKGGHAAVAQYLIAALGGNNQDARNNDGATPLLLAAEAGSLEVTKLLAHAGADVNAKDQGGRTALSVAAEHGESDIARFLADPDADKTLPVPRYGINSRVILTFNEALPAECTHPRFEPGSKVELIEGYELQGELPPGVTFDSTTGAFGGKPTVVPFDGIITVYAVSASARSHPCVLRVSVATDMREQLDTKFAEHLPAILPVFPTIRDLEERMAPIPEEHREAELEGIIETKMRIASPEVRAALKERLLQLLPRAESGEADDEDRDSESSTETDEMLQAPELAEEDVAVLSGEKPVASLNLVMRGLTADDAKVIAEYLKTNTTLTELSLAANKLGDEGAGYIADALRHNSTLQTLNLAGNDLGVEGARTLTQALWENTALRTLILGGNDLGAEGAQHLAKALRKNSTLQQLIMHKNNVGSDGAGHLADALRENSSLETLILVDSNIGAEGARYLADTLMENSTLKELSLDFNNLGAEGVPHLSEMLRVNSTLQKLSVSHNKLGEEGARAIAETLAEIPHLSLTSLAGIDLNKHRDVLGLSREFVAKSNEEILHHLRQVRGQQESKEEEQPSTHAASDMPAWLHPLAALMEAAGEVGQRLDDASLERLDDELRRCVLSVVTACGLPHHKLGVRCLWLVEKATMRAVAISPPAPNTLERWQVVEECSVELVKSAKAAPALPEAAEAVILRALYVLGVVGAPTRFTLLQLSSDFDAIRAAQQEHFEALTGVEDKLMYSKDVVERMKSLVTRMPPRGAPELRRQESTESEFIARLTSTPAGSAIKSKLGRKFLKHCDVTSASSVSQDQLPVLFVKLKVNSLNEVDIASSTFKADFTLMVDWYDPSVAVLGWNEDFIPKDHFYPVVLINNLADELEGEYNVQIRRDTKQNNPGYVKFTKRFVTKLTTPISCHEFPFDKQALQFEFRAQGIDGNPKIFVRFANTLLNSKSAEQQQQEAKTEDPAELYKRISPRPDFYHSTAPGANRLAEWQFHSLAGFPDFVVHDNNSDGAEGKKEESFSKADDITEKYVVQLWVARNPRAGFWNQLFPITLTGALSFAIYAVRIEDFGQRCGAVLTLLLTLVAFKFSLDKHLPRVPYVTTLDIHLLATMMILAVQLIGQSIASGWMGGAAAPLFEKAVGWLTGFCWAGLQLYMLDKMELARLSLPTGGSFFITPPAEPTFEVGQHDDNRKMRFYSAATEKAKQWIERNERNAQEVYRRRNANLQKAAPPQETALRRVVKHIKPVVQAVRAMLAPPAPEVKE